MKKIELKPCPFCGEKAEFRLESDHHGDFYNIGCPKKLCPANMAYYTMTEDEFPLKEAIAAWNRRVK